MDLMNADHVSKLPPSISVLQPSQKDNLLCFSPVQKKSNEVSFITPLRTATGRLKTINCRDGYAYLNSRVDKMGEAIEEMPNENYALEEQEKLNWRDRVEIITRQDHTDYMESAASFVDEMISNAICIAESKINSKKLVPKKSSLKQTKHEVHQLGFKSEISEDEFVDGTMFAQAVSSIDWDILASKGSSTFEQTDLSRQSLFAKFDPLYAKRQVARQELPRKSDIIDLVSYVPADTKDKRSRVTKSSVDFFFESPPALTSIDEETFSFKSTEQESTKTAEEAPKEQSSLAPIVDVLNYSEREIERLILQHRDTLLKKEEESLKEIEKCKQDRLLEECHLGLHEAMVQYSIETHENNYQGQKYQLNLYQTDLKEMWQTTDKVKNISCTLEKKFNEMKVLQSKGLTNTTQLKDSIEKANAEKFRNVSLKSYEDMLLKIKDDAENVSSRAQEVISKTKGAMVRANLKTCELDANLQKTALECEELGKICEELM